MTLRDILANAIASLIVDQCDLGGVTDVEFKCHVILEREAVTIDWMTMEAKRND